MRNLLYVSFRRQILAVVLALPAAARSRARARAEAIRRAGPGVISYTPADFAEAPPERGAGHDQPHTRASASTAATGFAVYCAAPPATLLSTRAGADHRVQLAGQRAVAHRNRTRSGGFDIVRGGAPGVDMQGQTGVARCDRQEAGTRSPAGHLGRRPVLRQDRRSRSSPTYSYQATPARGQAPSSTSVSTRPVDGRPIPSASAGAPRKTPPTPPTLFEEADTK